MKPVRCQFCDRKVQEPTGENALEQVLTCPSCKAVYWLEGADDLWEVPYHAAEHFGLPEEEALERIEYKAIRDFDRLLDYEGQPPEEGMEYCLVFSRVKQDTNAFCGGTSNGRCA